MNDLLLPFSGGPNIDQTFLNEQIGPEDPRYAQLCERYKDTPQGARIIRFHKENAKFQDGLPSKTMSQIDSLITKESVQYTGERNDRISKITAIRANRVEQEKEKLKEMTPEEREEYLKEKDVPKEDPNAKEEEEEKRRVAQREADRKAKLSAFEKERLKRLREREENKKKNNEFLDAEALRSSGSANPTAARKFAEAKRKKEAEETEEIVNVPDADTVNPLGASEPAPGEAGASDPGRTSLDDSHGASGADFGALTREDRKEELQGMNRDQLREMLHMHNLPEVMTMTNEDRVNKILDFEFQA